MQHTTNTSGPAPSWSIARAAALLVGARSGLPLDAALWPETAPPHIGDGKAFMRRVSGTLARWAARIVLESIATREPPTPADAPLMRAAAGVVNSPRHRETLKLADALRTSPGTPGTREHARRALALPLVPGDVAPLFLVEGVGVEEWGSLAIALDELHNEVATPCVVSEAVVGAVCEAVAFTSPDRFAVAATLTIRCIGLHALRMHFPGSEADDRDRAERIMRLATSRWLPPTIFYADDQRKLGAAANDVERRLGMYQNVFGDAGFPPGVEDVENTMEWARSVSPTSSMCRAVASSAEALVEAMRGMETCGGEGPEAHAMNATHAMSAATATLYAAAVSDPEVWACMARTIINDLESEFRRAGRRHAESLGAPRDE